MRRFLRNLRAILAILAVAGLMLCLVACGEKGKNKDSDSTSAYVVKVKDIEGAAIGDVSITFYDSEGNVLLNTTTNYTGIVELTDYDGDGCFAQITDVPTGYKLDSETKYEFKDSNEVSITLDADMSDANLDVYEATIDGGKYATFADALSVANTSSKDVTVTLASDIKIGEVTVNNLAGKNLTIDGNGHTVTTEGGNNAFRIYQEKGSVEFKNMKVSHKNTGGVFRTYSPLTLNVTDVDIDATQGNEYFYCLINTFGVGDASYLNLTRVNITMSVETAGKDSMSGVIRTGNSGVDQTKTVYMTLKDCNIDSSGATMRPGIMIMDSTTAEIKCTNTTFKTKDTYAIRANYQPIVLEGVTFESQTAVYKNSPIEDRSVVTSDNASQAYTGPLVAVLGETKYYSLASAIYAANISDSDEIITLIHNAEVREVRIENINGKNITIDGAGYMVTTQGGNNTFRVYQEEGTTEFKNMKIDHRNTGSVIQVYKNTTVNVTDVKIDATKGAAYNYCLVNLFAEGDTTNLNFTRVDAIMAVSSNGKDSRSAVIRTGNSDQKKTVLINLTDCNFDLTNATGRTGVMIMQSTTAYVVLTNTTISTMDTYPIRDNNQAIILNGCTLKSAITYYTQNPFEKGGNVTK